MIGLKTSLAAFSLLMAISPIALAQDVVPGGWSGQFGYQSLGAPGFDSDSGFGPGAASYGGGAGGLGFGAYPPGMAGAPFAGFGPANTIGALPGQYPGVSRSNFVGFGSGMPQTSVGTDPLLGAIQKTVRRAKRR